MLSRETLIGILATIAFHLLLALVIVSIRMREFKHDQELRFEMNIAEEVVQKTPAEQNEKMTEVNKEVLEKIYEEIRRQGAGGNEHRSNIGVNVSEKFKEEVSTKQYIQHLQNELGLKNVPAPGENNNGENSPQTKILEDYTASSARESYSLSSARLTTPIKGKRVVYKGPTNIYYDLEGRYDVHMVVPVYKCEGSGRVVVDIVVNQAGEVTSAVINTAESIHEECFMGAALQAALRSRFNASNRAPLQQKGVITYQFVAQ